MLDANASSSSGGNSRPYNPQADKLDRYISKAKVLLTNAQLPNVWAELQNRGYTVAAIQQKLADLDLLTDLNIAQRKEQGEQYQSTADYNAARKAMHKEYIDHLGYARMVFAGDEAARTGLGLKGRRARTHAAYAAQAFLFYTNLLNDAAWEAAIGTKGVTAAEMTAQQAAFESLNTLEAAQAKETGEAQGATAARTALYEVLKPWIKDFRATAKIALRKFPQLSEQLGIKYRS